MTSQILGGEYKIEKVLRPQYITKGKSEIEDRKVLYSEFRRQMLALLRWYDEQNDFITKKYQAQRARTGAPDSPDISFDRLHITSPRVSLVHVDRKSVLPPLPDPAAAASMTFLVAAALSADNATPFNVNWSEVQNCALQNFEDQKASLVRPIRTCDVAWMCTDVACKTSESYLNNDRVMVNNRKMANLGERLYTLADLLNQLVVKSKAVAVINAYDVGVVSCFYFQRTATNFDMYMYTPVDPNAGNAQTCTGIQTPSDFVKITTEHCIAALPPDHAGTRELPPDLSKFEFVLIEKYEDQ